MLRNGNGEVVGGIQVLRDQHEVRRLRDEIRRSYSLERLIGKNAPMQSLFQLLKRVAPTDSTVLISGESVTGKDLVARILHSHSPRRSQPFVKVNCGALPESLPEIELFGHVRGAFTGAVADRIDRFELANRGTIFLDEIGELPPPLQVKLLRVLQEREFERVGSPRTTGVDVRVLAATNRDLPAMVRRNEFREDLYYRLNEVPVEVPPLRAHPEDIILLADSFLAQMARRMARQPKRISPQALKLLLDYNWPGNVRQLENVLEYAVVTGEDDWIRRRICPRHFPCRAADATCGFRPP